MQEMDDTVLEWDMEEDVPILRRRKLLHASVRIGSDGRFGVLIECAACGAKLDGVQTVTMLLGRENYPHGWLWPSPEPLWRHVTGSPACGVYHLPPNRRTDPQRWGPGTIVHVREVDRDVEQCAKGSWELFERALKEMT
jgi:hypothetical protein